MFISFYALFIPFLIAYTLVFRMDRDDILKTFLALVAGVIIGSLWYIYIRVADSSSFLKTVSVETSRWSNYNVNAGSNQSVVCKLHHSC